MESSHIISFSYILLGYSDKYYRFSLVSKTLAPSSDSESKLLDFDSALKWGIRSGYATFKVQKVYATYMYT